MPELTTAWMIIAVTGSIIVAFTTIATACVIGDPVAKRKGRDITAIWVVALVLVLLVVGCVVLWYNMAWADYHRSQPS